VVTGSTNEHTAQKTPSLGAITRSEKKVGLQALWFDSQRITVSVYFCKGQLDW